MVLPKLRPAYENYTYTTHIIVISPISVGTLWRIGFERLKNKIIGKTVFVHSILCIRTCA